MKKYIVWNENKTEAFVTIDKQLAYEVRKSAISNCYDDNGLNLVAATFAEKWEDDNCTIEVMI